MFKKLFEEMRKAPKDEQHTRVMPAFNEKEYLKEKKRKQEVEKLQNEVDAKEAQTIQDATEGVEIFKKYRNND